MKGMFALLVFKQAFAGIKGQFALHEQALFFSFFRFHGDEIQFLNNSRPCVNEQPEINFAFVRFLGKIGAFYLGEAELFAFEKIQNTYRGSVLHGGDNSEKYFQETVLETNRSISRNCMSGSRSMVSSPERISVLLSISSSMPHLK